MHKGRTHKFETIQTRNTRIPIREALEQLPNLERDDRKARSLVSHRERGGLWLVHRNTMSIEGAGQQVKRSAARKEYRGRSVDAPTPVASGILRRGPGRLLVSKSSSGIDQKCP